MILEKKVYYNITKQEHNQSQMQSIKSITGQMISFPDQDIIVLYDAQGNQLVAIPKEEIDWSLRVLDNGKVVKEDGFTDRESYLRFERIERPTLLTPQQVMEENRVRQEEEEKMDEKEQDVICGGRHDTSHINLLSQADGVEDPLDKVKTQKDLREQEETRLMMMAETETLRAKLDLDRVEFEEAIRRKKPDTFLGICCARVGSGGRKVVGRCKAQARSTETDWEGKVVGVCGKHKSAIDTAMLKYIDWVRTNGHIYGWYDQDDSWKSNLKARINPTYKRPKRKTNRRQKRPRAPGAVFRGQILNIEGTEESENKI